MGEVAEMMLDGTLCSGCGVFIGAGSGPARCADCTPKQKKVQHVAKAEQSRGHRCHWPGCQRQVPPAMWGCKEHWFKLPKVLRDRIWATYRPGQEENLSPSEQYLAVADEVQLWIRSTATPRKKGADAE